MSRLQLQPASRWLIAALLFAAVYWSFDLFVLRAGVPHPLDDGWEDHLIAQHLVSGEGFRTKMIYPPLWTLRDPETRTVPVLVHGPLLPILTIAPLRILGPESLDRVAWVAAAIMLVSVVPVFRLVARHFGAPTGAVAAMLFTAAPITLLAVHHSLSVVIGALCLAITLDLLARGRPRSLAAGVITGIGYLVRPEMLLALPVLAFLGWRSSAREVIRFAAGFAAVASLWWWHNWREVGSPLFNISTYNLIGSWRDRIELSVLRDFDLPPSRWPEVLRAELPGLWRKWIAFLPHAAKNTLFSPSGGTGWLAIIGLWAAMRAKPGSPIFADGGPDTTAPPHQTRRFVVCAFLLALIPVATNTLMLYQRLYVVPFLFLHATGAAIGARVLLGRMPPWAHLTRTWILALGLTLMPSSLPALREGEREARLLERRLTLEREELARLAQPGSRRWIFSDAPDFVAWTTRRPTVWVTREEFEHLYGTEEGSRQVRRLGLPLRSELDAWFHDDPRDPRSIGKSYVAAPRAGEPAGKTP